MRLVPSRPIRPRAALRALAAVALCAALAGCSERRASRAFDAAVLLEKTRPVAEVRAELKALVARWPDTRAAARARHEIEWLDDLEHSSIHGQALLAWDAVRRVGMAVERYRLARGRYPERYADLVPRWLPGPILDPWGHAIGYQRIPSGYQAICYGADGIPGGSALDADIFVENGREMRPRARPN